MVIHHFLWSLNNRFHLAIETLNITRFTVKIGLKNQPSIRLFTTKLHFQTIETSEVFQEVTMERHVDQQFKELRQQNVRLSN